MKPSIFLKGLLSTASCVSLSLCLIGCNKKQDNPKQKVSKITINELTKITTKQYVTIHGTAENIFGDCFEVDFEEPTEQMMLVSTKINILDGSFDLLILIDSSISTDTKLSFNLIFTYKDYSGLNLKKTKISNFAIYYKPIKTDEDFVEIKNRVDTQNGSHEFNFDFQFSAIPQNRVVISIEEETGHVSLGQTEFRVPADTKQISVPILLDLAIIKTQTFKLAFHLTFTNSFGKTQETTFVGCVIAYNKNVSDIIPNDFYDIRENSTNGVMTLFGFKDNIPKEELFSEHYTTMIIPENVQCVSADAFGKEIYSNIMVLKLPSTLNDKNALNKRSFFGLINISELDISNFYSKPNWDISNFGTDEANAVFNTSKCSRGYIWTKNTNEDITNIFHDISYNSNMQNWNPNDIDLIIPDELYKFDEQDETELIGFDSEKLDELKKYKIIKIPKKVKKINEKCFDVLRTRPYEHVNSDGSTTIETRRLIIPINVESLPDECFYSCGIDGSILIYAYNLYTIPASCFENCTNYIDNKLSNVKHADGLYLYFDSAVNIQTIDNFAFFDIDILEINGIPTTDLNFDEFFKSLINIGSHAFFSTKIKNIKFTWSIDGVGDYAFSNDYFFEQDTKIETIDFSCYSKKKKIQDDEDTYLPPWFSAETHCFFGTTIEKPTVIFSTLLRDYVMEKLKETELYPQFSDWWNSFSNKQGIPQDANLVFVEPQTNYS